PELVALSATEEDDLNPSRTADATTAPLPRPVLECFAVVRSQVLAALQLIVRAKRAERFHDGSPVCVVRADRSQRLLFEFPRLALRSEEHTSELQSRGHLVCRLLLVKIIKLFLILKSGVNHIIIGIIITNTFTSIKLMYYISNILFNIITFIIFIIVTYTYHLKYII